ncbi:MAG: hypothetical protein ACRCY8_10465 [Dermatophilaceae bacterium]
MRPHAGSATTKAAVDAATLHRTLRTADVDSALQSWKHGRLRAGKEMLVHTAAMGRHLEPATRRVRHTKPWTDETASRRR